MRAIAIRGTSSGLFHRPWQRRRGEAIILGLLAFPATAGAMVIEPPIQGAATGEIVPKASPAAELSVVTSRGFSVTAATLQGLFTSRGEMINAVEDAETKPRARSRSYPWKRHRPENRWRRSYLRQAGVEDRVDVPAALGAGQVR